jgi:hypothetical protein
MERILKVIQAGLKSEMMIRLKGFAFFALILGWWGTSPVFGQCPSPTRVPLGAYLLITGDDQAQAWVNGNYLGQTPFYSYATVTTMFVPGGDLNPSGNNEIATTNFNNNPNAMGISYDLIIYWSDGTITDTGSDASANTIYQYYNGYNAAPSYSPPQGPLQWYDPGYNYLSAGWTTSPYPVNFTTYCYGGWTTITDPFTGYTPPWIGSLPCNDAPNLVSYSYIQPVSICPFLTPTPTFTPTVTPTPVPCAYALRVNVGNTGGGYIDSMGNGWSPDQAYGGTWGYTAGGVNDTTNPIAGTPDQQLYQDQRSNPAYQFNLPNGTYLVTMDFAQTNQAVHLPGQQVFSVQANGTTAIPSLDIIKKVGSGTALQVTFQVTVTGGVLTLTDSGATGAAPSWGAIQILGEVGGSCTPTFTWTPTPTATITNTYTPTIPISPTATNTTIQTWTPVPTLLIPTPVNCAFVVRAAVGLNTSYQDSLGHWWSPNQAYTAGSWGSFTGINDNATNPANIKGTADPTLFSGSQSGNPVEYIFTVPAAGNYTVSLLYAETFYTLQGSRVFSVLINGTTEIPSLDLDDYGEDEAKVFNFNITTTAGQAITIVENELPGSLGQPILSAVEVQSLSASTGCTSTSTWTYTPSVTPTNTVGVPTLTTTPVPCSFSQRVAVGNPAAVTDSNGNVWSADQVYAPGGWGYVASTTSGTSGPTALGSILGTSNPQLYQYMRNGAGNNPGLLTYEFTVPNGTYQVTMLLAELYFSTASNRVFNISAQGNTFVTSIDLAGAYGRNVAVDPSTVVTVSSGVLTITASSSVNVPVFNGIYIQGLGSSCTPTNTPTSTPMNSATNTATSTATKTSTNTATESATNTPTETFTHTIINSPTNTPTGTATNSSTATPTQTATQTLTNSPSLTATSSMTFTFTSTPSETFTNTLINTGTPTNTPLYTATSTLSPTLTSTNSLTPTNSFTLTATNTAVNTFTPTLTATGTPTLTNTLTPTNSFTLTTTNTVTSTFTRTLTFSATPTNTHTFSPTATPTITLTFTPSFTATPVGQYTMKVNVYNSSGEVVKTIEVVKVLKPVTSITLSSKTMTVLQGPGSTVQVYFEGSLIGVWDGTDNAGGPVNNGTYEIKIDNVDPNGVVTSVEQPVVVNRGLSSASVNIFNSAGEKVKNLYQVVADSTADEMTNVNLSTNVLRPSLAVSAKPSSEVQILVMTSGSAVTLSWDGTGDSGTVVTPGQYEIEVHWTNGQGAVEDIVREMMVMAGSESGSVVARPNELFTANGITTTLLDGSSVAGAASIKAGIYTVSGELVTVKTSPAGTPMVSWNGTGMASGIYIASTQVFDGNGNMIHQQFVKVLIRH